jgi:hypothetical protein
MNIFEQAVRQQLRFDLNGSISVEQLVAAVESVKNKANKMKEDYKTLLKNYGIQLESQLSHVKSSIWGSNFSKEDEITKLKLDIIVTLYNEIVEFEKQQDNQAKFKQKEQELLSLIREKQQESLKTKTIEELEEELKKLRTV